MGGAGDVTVHLNRFEAFPPAAACREAAEGAVRRALERGRGPGGEPVEVSVTCLDRGEIREMNRRYLDRDRPTDVIAFRLGRDPALLGDVYLCPEVAAEHAAERGLEASREVLRLVIHGVLHVLGWEHPEDEGREECEMFRLQERLLEETP